VGCRCLSDPRGEWQLGAAGDVRPRGRASPFLFAPHRSISPATRRCPTRYRSQAAVYLDWMLMEWSMTQSGNIPRRIWLKKQSWRRNWLVRVSRLWVPMSSRIQHGLRPFTVVAAAGGIRPGHLCRVERTQPPLWSRRSRAAATPRPESAARGQTAAEPGINARPVIRRRSINAPRARSEIFHPQSGRSHQARMTSIFPSLHSLRSLPLCPFARPNDRRGAAIRKVPRPSSGLRSVPPNRYRARDRWYSRGLAPNSWLKAIESCLAEEKPVCRAIS
jgi:hypothetical protein